MAETLAKFKDKLLWFLIPTLLGFFTWVVVTIMSVNTSVAKYQANEDNMKANQEQIIRTQKEVLVVARESRTFSMENNIILNDKADKTDVKDIDMRLRNIEVKVNQIYARKGINFSDGSPTIHKGDTIPIIYNSSITTIKATEKKIDSLIEIAFPLTNYTWARYNE